MAQQGTDDGVYRHIQLHPLQAAAAVHLKEDLGGVGVKGGAGQHLLAPVHLQLDAGVHIQGHGGGNGLGLLVEQSAATGQQHRQAGGGQGLYLPFWGCSHRDHISFPRFATGEDPLPVVGGGAVNGLGKALFQLPVGHRASSPSICFFSFFRARWYLDRTVGRGRSSRAAISRCRSPAVEWSRMICRSCSPRAARASWRR